MIRIVFRTDASTITGSGHVMRCLTLAEELRSNGAQVEFICREHEGNLCEYIEKKRLFNVYRLPAKLNNSQTPATARRSYSSWLGSRWDTDARQTIEILKQTLSPVDWLVVDHYALNDKWETALRPYSRNIAVIDDLANRKHDCDLLIDQNYYHNPDNRYRNLVTEGCVTLMGPKYSLISPEYQVARINLVARNRPVRNLLVYFGGTDIPDATSKTLKALDRPEFSKYSVHVVVGPNNPHKPQILKQCRNHRDWHCYGQLDSLTELLSNMDLFIGAGGATTWERCCLGVPGLIITVAPNQEEPAREMAEAGYQFLLGRADVITSMDISRALSGLLCQPLLLRHLSQQVSRLVDGRGAERIAKYFLKKSVILRTARSKDLDSLFAWRNDDEVRRHAANPEPIAYDTHCQWFMNTLNDPNKALLIAEHDHQPVGVLRFDLAGLETVISVYVVPGLHGKGWGTEIILAGLEWLRANKNGITRVVANIKPDNRASIQAFQRAGFSHALDIFDYRLH
jgi:UDP-2,4-diacetamido-2,4,6-trideoxy-beta-L-altropyranose hydrolase